MAKKSTKKPAPKKPPVISGAVLTGNTAIAFKAQREKSGPKTNLLALVPRKGSITVKELAAKAESEGIKATRVPKFVASLARFGYVEFVK